MISKFVRLACQNGNTQHWYSLWPLHLKKKKKKKKDSFTSTKYIILLCYLCFNRLLPLLYIITGYILICIPIMISILLPLLLFMVEELWQFINCSYGCKESGLKATGLKLYCEGISSLLNTGVTAISWEKK